MDAAHQEGDDGVPLAGLAQYTHAGNPAHALQCITGQFLLVRIDAVHAQSGNVIEGARQSRGGHVVGRAGLELERQSVEGGMPERDVPDHLAASHIRRQPVEPRLFAIKHAHARGAVNLMAAEGKEIRIERLHVYRKMRGALRSVHQYGHAVGMGDADHPAHGVDRAQHVAHVRHADDARAVVEEPFVFVQHQFATVVYRNYPQLDALARL